jgi:hypothetical protein
MGFEQRQLEGKEKGWTADSAKRMCLASMRDRGRPKKAEEMSSWPYDPFALPKTPMK